VLHCAWWATGGSNVTVCYNTKLSEPTAHPVEVQPTWFKLNYVAKLAVTRLTLNSADDLPTQIHCVLALQVH
jgi:hypothetical protein